MDFELKTQLTIALDAMGGDEAPQMVIEGVNLARVKFPNVRFLLFGDEDKINPLLNKNEELKNSVSIRHTTEFVSAEERPTVALRQGRQSSMQLAINAVRDGDAAGIVSAGNTGALMAMSKICLKMLPGITRPAIAAPCPTRVGESVMLDLGANIESDAENLVQFGMLGAAFARTVFGIEQPTVGLLNVGAEEAKGRESVRQAASIFKERKLPFKFHGFVEGDDIGAGTVDVFIVDGFTGNITLKAVEGTVRLYTEYLRQTYQSSVLSKLSYFLAKGAFKKMRARIDPRIYNGATFLGLNGIVVKSHGGTDAFGFSNAIAVAINMIANDLNGFVTRELTEYSEQDIPQVKAG